VHVISFLKKIHALLGNQNILVVIHGGSVKMVIEIFLSPSNTPPLFDGNQMVLVIRKGGHIICFWKAFDTPLLW
jgi:broad specificity phosphatase PhoE